MSYISSSFLDISETRESGKLLTESISSNLQKWILNILLGFPKQTLIKNNKDNNGVQWGSNVGWIKHAHIGKRQGNLFIKLEHRQKIWIFQGQLTLV